MMLTFKLVCQKDDILLLNDVLIVYFTEGIPISCHLDSILVIA